MLRSGAHKLIGQAIEAELQNCYPNIPGNKPIVVMQQWYVMLPAPESDPDRHRSSDGEGTEGTLAYWRTGDIPVCPGAAVYS